MFSLNYNTNDPSKPSFFEMYAQSELTVHMKPALQYVFSVLSVRNPVWGAALNYTDEIFHSCQFLVERFYLKNYDASFSENFYSLRRLPISNESKKYSDKLPSLSKAQRWRSLAFLVLVPYIKAKLDSLYKKLSGRADVDNDDEFVIPNEDIQANENNIQTNSRFSRLLLKLILKLYPFFNLGYEGALLGYQIAYMHDLTRFYDWFSHLQGIEIKRMDISQLIAQQNAVAEKRNKFLSRWIGRGVLGWLMRRLYEAYCFLFDYSPYFLPFLIFMFKFAEWWYSENGASVSQAKQVPPPPRPPQLADSGIPLPADRSICAICENARTNAAVLSSSGFVFCYPCIHNFVEENGHCPLTLMPSTVEQIRRIYESSN